MLKWDISQNGIPAAHSITDRMTDRVDRATRSRIMGAVRASGNRSTETALRMRLVRAGLSGWRLNAADLIGRCDFAFDNERLAIFVDGCQWHGCPSCYRPPKSNAAYWREKLQRNRRRDRQVNRTLRGDGWTVIRIWEHQLRRNPQSAVQRVVGTLAASK